MKNIIYYSLITCMFTAKFSQIYADIRVENKSDAMLVLQATYENKNKVPSPNLPPIYLAGKDTALLYYSLSYYGGDIDTLEVRNEKNGCHNNLNHYLTDGKIIDGKNYIVDSNCRWGLTRNTKERE